MIVHKNMSPAPWPETEYSPRMGLRPCQNVWCLLRGSPPVAVIPLVAKSMKESLLGKTEGGATFKMGKAKFTKGNVAAARELLRREFPQVNK